VALLSGEPRVVIAAVGLQYALAALHVLAWVLHSAPLLDSTVRSVRGAIGILLPLAVALAVPGAVFREPVRSRTVAWLGALYLEPEPTPFAHVATALLFAVMIALAALHLRSWRRGAPRGALLTASAIGFLALAGGHDALALSGWVSGTPELLAPSALVPVTTVAWMVASRFVADTRGLARLRVRLQRRVRGRTRVLALSRAALQRTDAPAALGRLARRAAHEVNNPVAVVTVNLAYASEHLGAAPPDEEVADALRDVRDALRRLRVLALRLTDIGGAPAEEPRRVPLALAVSDALALARERAGADVRVPVDLDVDGYLATEGDRAILCRALEDLIANGLRSAADKTPPGSLAIRASRSEEWITLRIEDSGPGMDEVVLRRLGEPFFTTRPFERTGLGVAVARALIQSLGGRLSFVSVRGSGTCAVVELPARARSAQGPRALAENA
jgi:signal transduction histidine kinase